MAFDRKKNIEEMKLKLPPICGVAGCKNETDIYIKFKNISRCYACYQKDVDEWGKNHTRGSATRDILRTMDEQSDKYRRVKSGAHLVKILSSLYQR